MVRSASCVGYRSEPLFENSIAGGDPNEKKIPRETPDVGQSLMCSYYSGFIPIIVSVSFTVCFGKKSMLLASHMTIV